MRTFYTQTYLVADLRDLLRRWIQADSFFEFRGRIVDAIEGHSERDHVALRLDNDRQVRLFEFVADREMVAS